MKQHLLFSLSFILLVTGFFLNVPPVYSQIDRTFTASNEGTLQIIGTEQHYELFSNVIRTRVDRDRKQIEFILPLESLQAVADPLHLQILKDIFPSPSQLYFTATFDRQTISIEEFSQPVQLELNGVMTLNDEQFQLPIEISIYAVDETLFYNMVTRFNLDLLDRNYEGIYKEIITGEFVLIVNEAIWNNDFSEY